MIVHRFFKWMAIVVVAIGAVVAILFAVFDWNWLRAPIERRTLEQTGRELAINGNLRVSLGWPLIHVRADDVTFGNPSWTKEKDMVRADEVEFTIGLPQLLKKSFDMHDVRLLNPVVNLQVSPDGRKNWLLDKEQRDESARVQIDRLTLDHGQLSIDDPREKTLLHLDVSTQDTLKNGSDKTGVVFNAKGQYKGLALKAQGSGGPVLALNDETLPYPLKVVATIDHTTVRASGTITGLTKVATADMQLTVDGDNLAKLYPMLGLALPETHAYNTTGHITHLGKMWRYEKFTGQVGNSDFSGTLQLDNDAKRPYLQGELIFQLLDIADIGPLIGAQQTMPATAIRQGGQSAEVPSPTAPPAAGATARVLPEIPFRTERWNSVDADVKLRAKTIRRDKALPIENLIAHLKMQDSVLTLDPLDFGVANGTFATTISLNGQKNPIQAHAKIHIRKILLNKLFPTVDLTKTSIGEVNGEVDLEGSGNYVGRMLGTANGKFALVVAGGEISKLMMEMAGLHLWEILKLEITGDQVIPIRCGVADFDVKNGIMSANVFVLDTTVTNIGVTGTVDLHEEKLDLILTPKTKQTSVIALRSPIHIHGTFANPQAEVDKGRIAARGLGAVALGIVSPLLALIPLVETGPGKDSDCGRLIQQALQPASGMGASKNSPRSVVRKKP